MESGKTLMPAITTAVITLVLVCATGALPTPSARAASEDPQFKEFWTKFKTAVAKNDKQAVAAMTKLPYLLDSKKLDKTQFVAKYNLLFPKGTAACFAKEKPGRDQALYEVFCGEQIYIFEKVNGKWMFSEIGVND
jgi:hypothetical protein